MRTRYLNGLLAAALLAPAPMLGTRADSNLTVQPQSRLWIEGNSTVRAFSCKAPSFEASIETTSTEAVPLVLAGEKAVRSVEIKVPAQRIDCGNGTMNDHMYKAIKAKEHPVVTFRLSGYELARAGEGAKIRMNGKLSLGGTEKPIALEAAATQGSGGTLVVTGSEEILLSEYGLKAPSLMMGTMKVNDRVKVSYELVLKP